jgi:hypothetical protein
MTGIQQVSCNLLRVLAAGTQRGEQHEPERSSQQQFLPVRTPGGIS